MIVSILTGAIVAGVGVAAIYIIAAAIDYATH